MKYTKFCRGINLDCLASLKKILMLIKYIKKVLWEVAKRLFYIQDARYLKVKYARMGAR